MYRSVVPAIVPDVAPGTLISVGGVTIFDVAAAPACPAGHARQSDVLLTQLFSCADAWAKTSFDRCVFQIYSFESCQSAILVAVL